MQEKLLTATEVFLIAVNDSDAKKSVDFHRVFVVTELVVSWTGPSVGLISSGSFMILFLSIFTVRNDVAARKCFYTCQ